MRVQLERQYPDRLDLSAGVTAGVAPLMKESFPEVETYAKLWSTSHIRNIIQKEDLSIEVDKLYFASEDFFKVFSFPLINGDPITALEKPNSVVITKSTAKRIFGEVDPLGKTFIYHNPWEASSVVVTGVTEDPPENSHLKYNMLVSFATLVGFNSGARDSFGWSAFNTYLLMKPGVLAIDFQERVNDFIATNYAPLIERGVDVNLYFQPISEIHLGPQMRFQPEPGGNGKVLGTLSIAAAFILLLAWLNYVNLSTSNIADRAKEVGVRKVSGATKSDLILQFLFESFMMNAIAMFISLMIVELSHEQLTNLIGKELPGNVYLRKDIWTIACLLVGGGTILSGLYPALSLASFKPVAVLKGSAGNSGFLGLRRGLVVFQLAVSFVLISGTLVIFEQVKFMQNRDLGVNMDEVLVLKGPGLVDSTWSQKLHYFKERASRYSGVYQAANTTAVPGFEITWVNNSVRWVGNPDDNDYSLPFTGISADYLELMRLDLLAGRSFINGKEAEERTIMLTESAARILGFETPEQAVGETVLDSNTEYTVIGVCADYHQQSLNKKISPIIFRYVPNASSYLVFKVNTSNLEQTLEELNAEWNAILAGNPFDYFFLDEFFDAQYSSNQRFVNILGIFTIIGVFIGGLGLLALSLFMVKRREAEASIRKVMGASDLQIAKLFSLEVLAILSVAIILGVPLSWFLSDVLLQNYPYKSPFQWSWILVPAIVLIVILIATSAWRIIRVSQKNPVEVLREQ